MLQPNTQAEWGPKARKLPATSHCFSCSRRLQAPKDFLGSIASEPWSTCWITLSLSMREQHASTPHCHDHEKLFDHRPTQTKIESLSFRLPTSAFFPAPKAYYLSRMTKREIPNSDYTDFRTPGLFAAPINESRQAGSCWRTTIRLSSIYPEWLESGPSAEQSLRTLNVTN